MSKKDEALKLALEALEVLGWQPTEEAMDYRDNAIDAIHEALAPQPAPVAKPHKQQESVAWRDHVEQRLLTWRQSFVNRSGDQLALDDFMDKQSLDDLIDFVCDEYTSPPASKPWVGLTGEEKKEIERLSIYVEGAIRHTEAKLREKNHG